MSLRLRLLLAFAYGFLLIVIALEVPLALNLRSRVDAEVRNDAAGQAHIVAAVGLKFTTTGDTRTDNDGYAQRFTTSCAPGTALMVRGEADPVWAMMINSDGLQNLDPSSGVSQ